MPGAKCALALSAVPLLQIDNGFVLSHPGKYENIDVRKKVSTPIKSSI